MSKHILLQYVPTREDYFNTALLFYRQQKLTWVIVAVFGGLFVLGSVGLALTSMALPSLLSMLLLPAFLVLLWASQVQVMRSADRNERMRAETTWEVSLESIVTRNRFGDSRCDWGTFSRILEDRNYFLLFYSTNPRMFQFVPKRAFRSPEDMQAFREMARYGMEQAEETAQSGEGEVSAAV